MSTTGTSHSTTHARKAEWSLDSGLTIATAKRTGASWSSVRPSSLVVSTDGQKNDRPRFLCLNTLFVFTNYHPRQYNTSYNRHFTVDWSLSGIMTSKLVILESESTSPAIS